jgi:hypothetical protein
MLKLLPDEDFIRAYGEYIPRLCVDTAVIGPEDILTPMGHTSDFCTVFRFHPVLGVAHRERNEMPRVGQWGLPGGGMFKGEHPYRASKRLVRSVLGIDIEPLGVLGWMYFPNEERNVYVSGVRTRIEIDSCSLVVIARALSPNIVPKKGQRVMWVKDLPPVHHDIHTPFLAARGLLATATP